jgi:hypothetical protein
MKINPNYSGLTYKINKPHRQTRVKTAHVHPATCNLATDSLDTVVLPATSASRYHNCCIDGGTNPEYFGNTLVARTLLSITL